MRITSERVVAGKVEVEGERLPEGSVVTVLARDVHETFELDSSAEAELLESISEAERGQTVSAEAVLRTLQDQE